MRVRTSAISVPVSLIYAAAAVSTGQAIIIALGIVMVVVAAGYLVSELVLKGGAPGEMSPSPVKADETSTPRRFELGRASAGENLFAAIFVVVTAALSIMLAAHAAMG